VFFLPRDLYVSPAIRPPEFQSDLRLYLGTGVADGLTNFSDKTMSCVKLIA